MINDSSKMSQHFNLRTYSKSAVLLATIVTVTAAAFGIPASVSAIVDSSFEQKRSQDTVDFEGETTVCENGEPCSRQQTICQPDPEACKIANDVLNMTVPGVGGPSFPFGN